MQNVRVALFNKEHHTYIDPDNWVFAAKHKWQLGRKLQLLAFKWLTKHGALTNATRIEYEIKETELLNNDPTIESIRDVVYEMESQCNSQPAHLYIGRDVADKFMRGLKEAQHFYPISFTHGAAQEIMGIPWTIVPWMNGWVVVPEQR